MFLLGWCFSVRYELVGFASSVWVSLVTFFWFFGVARVGGVFLVLVLVVLWIAMGVRWQCVWEVCLICVDRVLSWRFREKEWKVKRRKVTSVVARSGYKAYGLFIRLHGWVYGYDYGCFTDSTAHYWIRGGGISAIRLCVRLYSGLQHLLLCLSIWRYVLHVVVVFAPVFGGLLVWDLRLNIRNDHFRMCTLWCSG